MTGDQAPRVTIPLPEIGVPTMHRLPNTRRVAGWLHYLCTHNDGNITINANMFDNPVERGVMSQTLIETYFILQYYRSALITKASGTPDKASHSRSHNIDSVSGLYQEIQCIYLTTYFYQNINQKFEYESIYTVYLFTRQ